MAIITLCSASGSPGVSTTALGLALTWPRPVILVEADPSGSQAILSGYYRGSKEPTPGQKAIPGLLELSVEARQGRLQEQLPLMLMDEPKTNAKLLLGTASHVQNVVLTRLWDDLLLELQSPTAKTGQDVIVDAGRLGLEGSPAPFVRRSDVTLLLTRSTVRDFVGARSWAHSLIEGSAVGRYVGAVVVGPGRPYGVREASLAMGIRAGSNLTKMPILGGVDWAPRHAASLSDGEAFPKAWWKFWKQAGSQRDFDRSGFMRSIRALGEAARTQVQRIEEEMGAPAASDLAQWEGTR